MINLSINFDILLKPHKNQKCFGGLCAYFWRIGLGLIKPFYITHQKLSTWLVLSKPFLVSSFFSPESCNRPLVVFSQSREWLVWLHLRLIHACRYQQAEWFSLRQSFSFSGIQRLNVCYCPMQKRTFWKWVFLVIYWPAYVSLAVGSTCEALLFQHLLSFFNWHQESELHSWQLCFEAQNHLLW